MVLVVLAIQPVGNVYVIDAVPAAPPPVMVAVPALPDMVAPPVAVHVPPAVTSLTDTDKPAHSAVNPCIGIGLGFTLTAPIATQLPDV